MCATHSQLLMDSKPEHLLGSLHGSFISGPVMLVTWLLDSLQTSNRKGQAETGGAMGLQSIKPRRQGFAPEPLVPVLCLKTPSLLISMVGGDLRAICCLHKAQDIP